MSAPVLDRPGRAGRRPASPPGLSDRGRLRVRPVPPLEPPYDDEIAAPHLYLVPSDELPFEEPPPRRFARPIDFFDRQPTSRQMLPEAEVFATRFIQALLETLVGRRPPAQLREWTTAAVFASVSQQVGRRSWAHPGSPPPTMHSIRIGEPADGVAEVSAVIQRGQRYLAIAARLEGLDGRWRCVALRVG
jgi:Family of unknown function (DUF6459)